MSERAASVDLDFIARQLQRVLDNDGQSRDDLAVMMAMMQRMDGPMSGLVNEVRAMHAQHARLDRRVGQLEQWRDASPPTP